MKIVFNLPEDDPKNPGVIADCTGDNAGDSVGPTADGFETYGVTGVALIAFLALALARQPGARAACSSLAVRDAHPDDPHFARQLLGQRHHQPARSGATRRTSISSSRSPIWSGSPRSFRSASPSSRATCCWRNSRGQPGLWWVLSTIISLRHDRRRADSGVHQDLHLAPKSRT